MCQAKPWVDPGKLFDSSNVGLSQYVYGIIYLYNCKDYVYTIVTVGSRGASSIQRKDLIHLLSPTID